MIPEPGQLGPLSTGSTILCSGNGWRVSLPIKVWTFSRYSHIAGLVFLRRWHWERAWGCRAFDNLNLSHHQIWRTAQWLGDGQNDGRWIVFESTTLNDRPCCLTGRKIKGVQAHPLTDFVEHYDGKVFLLPLAESSRLSDENAASLGLDCLAALGDPYDTAGALVAGTFFLKRWLYATTGRPYCAEFWHNRLAERNLMDRSGLVGSTPASMYRRQRRSGVCTGPLRVLRIGWVTAIRDGKKWWRVP